MVEKRQQKYSGDWEIVDETWAMGSDEDVEAEQPLPAPITRRETIQNARDLGRKKEQLLRKAKGILPDQQRHLTEIDVFWERNTLNESES